VLGKTPGVRESCVIGLDKGTGEEVHAVLLLDESGTKPEEIIGQANKSLDTVHQITGFTVWAEPEFPKTTTLKIKKFQVLEQVKKGAAGKNAGISTDALINLIARVTGTGTAEIHEESLLENDLGLTSIDRLELVNFLEQEYRLDIEDSQIGPLTKVSDLRQIIAKREKVSSRDHFRFWTNSGFVTGLRKVWDSLFHYPLFRSFTTLDIHGMGQLNKLDGPVIFVANHLSYIDHMAVMFALPPKFRYKCATAAWAEFFFGDFHGLDRIWRRLSYEYTSILFNLFPLPQSAGFSGSLEFMGKLTDAGINILLFPEGGHSLDGKIQQFQMGLGIMVKELGVPVVPIKISGTDKILPHEVSFLKHGRVSITFGEPMKFRYEEPAEIVKITQQAVEQL